MDLDTGKTVMTIRTGSDPTFNGFYSPIKGRSAGPHLLQRCVRADAPGHSEDAARAGGRTGDDGAARLTPWMAHCPRFR
ncbi:hypothetical protein ACU4GD_31070 [Cupriavidus basilensis]